MYSIPAGRLVFSTESGAVPLHLDVHFRLVSNIHKGCIFWQIPAQDACQKSSCNERKPRPQIDRQHFPKDQVQTAGYKEKVLHGDHAPQSRRNLSIFEVCCHRRSFEAPRQASEGSSPDKTVHNGFLQDNLCHLTK